VLERAAERELHHLARLGSIPIEAREREAEQAREEALEQLAKRPLVAGPDAAAQRPIGVQGIHDDPTSKY
jgi:hypothetical protein